MSSIQSTPPSYGNGSRAFLAKAFVLVMAALCLGMVAIEGLVTLVLTWL